ncbi:hypothetical protein NCCP2495_26410 [Dietzia sp. NCCP-2495]|uniref:hypothetical protein n=1 Tax=Dietzia sp. NCCP-2495 TaxID=2934675 RepID=UPI0022314EDB|nr:hypothetical protein [Dietzia sp. NCCP-2495]GLB64761.1 hypothetical protein NCCP2495_26410 [Dietzia sp. NCCP-2495]
MSKGSASGQRRQSRELAYAFEAVQVFGYHPPSRRETADKLFAWAQNEGFRYV